MSVNRTVEEDFNSNAVNYVWADVKRHNPHRWCWVVWSGSRIVRSGICPTKLIALLVGNVAAIRFRSDLFRGVER